MRNAFSHGAMNCKLTSPYIQKDIARCCAEEIIDVIMGGIEDRNYPFLLMSQVTFVKEKMAVMLRFVYELDLSIVIIAQLKCYIT